MKTYIATALIKAQKGTDKLPKDHLLQEEYELTLPSGYSFWMPAAQFEGMFREVSDGVLEWLKED